MNTNHRSKRLLSLLLTLCMMLSVMPTAFAHAEDEEDTDHDHDATPYSITIYNEKAPNKNGTLTYTVTCHEDGTVSEIYDVDDADITAVEGDLITLYPEANEGYALGSIGYVRSDRVEQAFNIKSVTDNKDGGYSFTMPANNIYIGAAFYDEKGHYVIGESGSSNSVANVEPLHLIELGLNHAWIHENTEEISVDMYLDKRILTFDETLTFRMEIRQVGDSGFILKGSKEYTVDELQTLIEAKSTGTKTDDKSREIYILRDATIPVDTDQDFTYTDDGEYEVYCTAMYTLDGWTNAVGAPFYRWAYSGGDRAYILENETPIPTSMGYLYNLEPDTYHGALVADAIDRVEEEMGITIETRYFTPENMTECIGYLAEWPDYASFGELGVDRQPSEKVFKKKIVLYCSLPSMVRDAVGDAVRETGVTQYMTTKLTTYGAAKSFEELYKNQEAESEVFTAALALSLLAYEASEAVPESEYGTHELWDEFCAAMATAKTLINEAKEVAEPYRTAREQLLDVYLRILGKTALDVDFGFVIHDYDENNYKISVGSADSEAFPEDLKLEYYWYDASKEDHLIIPKNELYKVRCSVSAAEDCPYYGFKEIRLAAPAEPEYSLESTDSTISVDFTKYESLTNTPEPITYIAELYQNDTLISTLSNETAEALTFTDLTANTEYTLRLYATNIVGRTTYCTETVATCNMTKEEDNDSTGTGVVVRPSIKPDAGTVELPFIDVAEDAYYAEAVQWAVEEEITTGTSAAAFSPDASCTRAQAVTFLWRAAGAPAPKANSMPFADVTEDTYYYDAVLWAIENGITNGTSADSFSPNARCTRAQIVTFLFRCMAE